MKGNNNMNTWFNYRFIMRCFDNEGIRKCETGKGVCVPLVGIKSLSGAINRIKKYNLNNGLRYEIEDIMLDKIIKVDNDN